MSLSIVNASCIYDMKIMQLKHRRPEGGNKLLINGVGREISL